MKMTDGLFGSTMTLCINVMTVSVLQQLFKWTHVVNDPWGFLDVQDTFQLNPVKNKKLVRLRMHIHTITNMMTNSSKTHNKKVKRILTITMNLTEVSTGFLLDMNREMFWVLGEFTWVKWSAPRQTLMKSGK